MKVQANSTRVVRELAIVLLKQVHVEVQVEMQVEMQAAMQVGTHAE